MRKVQVLGQGRGRSFTPAAERFWAKVDRRGPDECWPWIGVRFRGYGLITINNKTVRTHRFSLGLSGVEIPIGMHVLHRCDNPSCVNPAHLFVGTHADNMADKARKGRGTNGEKSRSAKLRNADIPTIRQRCANGETQVSVARSLGVAPLAIKNIVNRKSWKHVL